MGGVVAWLNALHVSLFWLCLARAGGLFAVAPALSDSHVPAQVRAALSVLVALAVMPAARVQGAVPHAVLPYIALMAREVLVGLAIGFVARLVFSMAEMAGQLVDLQMGFSLGNLIDPVYGEPSSVLGTAMNVLATLLFLVGGGLNVLVLALAGSYAHLPIGATAVFAAASGAAASALSWALLTAVEVAAPALVLGLILNLVLGLLGRAMPQLNVLQVALPVQVMGGLAALAIALPVVFAVFGRLPAQTATSLGRLLP